MFCIQIIDKSKITKLKDQLNNLTLKYTRSGECKKPNWGFTVNAMSYYLHSCWCLPLTAGILECEGSVVGVKGTVKNSTELTVMFLPEASLGPKEQTVFEGERGNFTCQGRDVNAVISDEITIQWFVNDQPGKYIWYKLTAINLLKSLTVGWLHIILWWDICKLFYSQYAKRGYKQLKKVGYLHVGFEDKYIYVLNWIHFKPLKCSHCYMMLNIVKYLPLLQWFIQQ